MVSVWLDQGVSKKWFRSVAKRKMRAHSSGGSFGSIDGLAG